MNKRVLSLTLLLVCFSLVMQAEGRIVEPFNFGWVFKKAPAGKELAVNAPNGRVDGPRSRFLTRGMQKICRRSMTNSTKDLPTTKSTISFLLN